MTCCESRIIRPAAMAMGSGGIMEIPQVDDDHSVGASL